VRTGILKIILTLTLFAGLRSAAASTDVLASDSESAREALLAKTEQQAIDSLSQIIAKRDEPELHYRLAELYMRQSKSARYFESLRKGLKTEVPLPGIQSSLKKAISTYTLIEQRWPQYKDLDGVHFNHGLACLQQGEVSCAKGQMEILIKQFPTSVWLGDARLCLGEIYYDQHDFKTAIKNYELVPEGRMRSYSRYKMAWSYYNLKDNEQALKHMRSVIHTPKVGETSLLTEGLRDLALFLESDSQPHNYLSFFKEVCAKACGSKEIGDTLLTLGNLFSAHDKLNDLQKLSAELVKNHEYKSTQLAVLLILVKTQDKQPLKANLHEAVVNTLKEGFLLCPPATPSAPKAVVKAEEKLVENAAKTPCDELVSITKELAKKWSENFHKPRWTLQALELLIRHDPFGDEALHLSRAEILFQVEDFKSAYPEYAESSVRVCQKTGTPLTYEKPELCEKLAYGALVSADRAGLPPHVLIEKALTYLSLPSEITPKARREETTLTLGIRYYQAKDLKNAETWLLKIETQLPAQDTLLKILAEQKRYSELKDKSASYAKLTQDPARKTSLEGISTQAYYQFVQTDKKPDLLLQFAMDNEPSDLAESTLWQVISLRHKDEYFLAGGDLCLYLTSHYPKSSRASECRELALSDYKKRGDLKTAEALETQLAKDGVEPYSSFAKLRDIESLLKNKDWNRAYREATELWKASNHSEVKAHAQWIRAQVFEHEFDQQSTRTSLERLPLVLSMKAEKLEKTQQTYSSVLKSTSTGELRKEALNGILRSLQKFVGDLKEPNLTEEVPENQLLQLKKELAKVRMPAEQRIAEVQTQLAEMKP
jgi:TolA-binding protein